MSKSFLMARVLSERGRARHIALRWRVTIMDADYTETALQKQSYLNCLDVAVRHYASHIWDAGLSMVSGSASLDWIMPSIYEPEPPLAILRALVTVSGSPQNLSSSADPVKRFMLVLPNQIDIVGSTAIVRRTLALTYYGWSSFSGGDWQRPPPNSLHSRTVMLSLPLSLATPGDGPMRTGAQDTKRTSD